jgi:RimJ/RimL family protein N-acetyltransferase
MLEVLADDDLYRHTGGEPPSLAEVRARYTRQATGTSPDGRQGWLNWVLRLREDARLVGFVQATLSEDGATRAELAWLIASADQGEGLATEAASAVVEWLATVGITSLSAHIHPDNVASEAVARRLGLVATDEVKDGETRWLVDGD